MAESHKFLIQIDILSRPCVLLAYFDNINLYISNTDPAIRNNTAIF